MARKINIKTRSGGGSVHISTKEPPPPPDADFALYIDFAKGVGRPERVFKAAEEMIRALQALDRTLCAAVDNNIEPVMVLEEIETGSIKIWLSNQLNRVDDDALKKLDWKPLIGKYLVRAKYAFIKWSNKEGSDGSLVSLARDIRQIAEETDVRHVPAYMPPSVQELADAAKAVNSAKSILLEGDKMSFISNDDPPIDFDLSIRWSLDELNDLSVKDVTTFSEVPMILIVKRPDYLGQAKWDLRHGKKPIAAKIEDVEWLARFQSRKLDVRPGDALRCRVTIEHKYGHNNELISEEYVVTTVEGIMENQYAQHGFDFDDK